MRAEVGGVLGRGMEVRSQAGGRGLGRRLSQGRSGEKGGGEDGKRAADDFTSRDG